jgi:perosamine synthetase
MSNVQAAIGCGQVERIDELTARKRSILGYYRANLDALPGLSMNPEPEGSQIGAWMPSVVFDQELGITREMLLSAFKEESIDARVFFYPLSGLSMFSARPENSNAWSIPNFAINLPSYHDMTREEQDRVLKVIRGLHAQRRSSM